MALIKDRPARLFLIEALNLGGIYMIAVFYVANLQSPSNRHETKRGV